MTAEDKIAKLYQLLRSSFGIARDRAMNPQPGDIVIECSRFLPDPSMVGVLDAIEGDESERTYYVTSLDGEKQRWLNAVARTVRIA